MAKPVSEDIRFRVMRDLEADPKLSQRDLARSLGISLGVVNYCLKGLIEKGQVKVGNFLASGNEALIAEIEALQQEINSEVIGQVAPEDVR